MPDTTKPLSELLAEDPEPDSAPPEIVQWAKEFEVLADDEAVAGLLINFAGMANALDPLLNVVAETNADWTDSFETAMARLHTLVANVAHRLSPEAVVGMTLGTKAEREAYREAIFARMEAKDPNKPAETAA